MDMMRWLLPKSEPRKLDRQPHRFRSGSGSGSESWFQYESGSGSGSGFGTESDCGSGSRSGSNSVSVHDALSALRSNQEKLNQQFVDIQQTINSQQLLVQQVVQLV